MQQYVEEENLEGKMNIARKHAIEKLNWQHNSAELHKFIQKTNVTPLTQAMAATYNKFKYYGYRKILTKIEKHQNFFSPLLHLYSKLKK